jgi:hypothetical protein
MRMRRKKKKRRLKSTKMMTMLAAARTVAPGADVSKVVFVSTQ